MATELKGVPIGSLPEASNLNTTDQLIAYRGGQAYRSNVGALGEAANDNISDAFDSGKSYVAGDYAIYNDTLFKFTADHSGSWNSADVEQVTVGTELSELNTKKIQTGYYTASSGQISASGTTEIPITFDWEFDSAPFVCITLSNMASTNYANCCFTITGAPTTTGFTVRVINGTTSTGLTPTIRWIAIVV